MASKPIPPKIGWSDQRFMRVCMICIVIVVAVCLAVIFGWFEPESSEIPQKTVIEQTKPLE